MALHSLRVRRAFSLSYPLLHQSLHQPKPISSLSSRLISSPISNPSPSAAVIPSSAQSARPFTSTSTLLLKRFDPDTDEIRADTILFEGCDYNHWLIVMDFPKDSNITREQKIEAYINTAAQIFGSVEEAKKKIYALSTTTYEGFQVMCSEETSDKFYGLPGVVFVLPDSYIDPVNKEYGGDKYVNGEIFPRPPPVHYGRRDNRDRRRRDNFGPPQQQNYGPPQQENYGPSPQQNYGPPPQQNYGPPPQQNYGPPQQENYGPPQQQNYGPPPRQNYGLPVPPQKNFGSPPQENYGPPPRQNYGPPPPQNYGPPPQQSYGNSPTSSTQHNYGPPPEQESFSHDAAYGSSQGGHFDQVPGAQRNFSSVGNN